MSYKLVNANDLVISYPEVNINSFPCIFADLPNGIDGGHYTIEEDTISRNSVKEWYCNATCGKKPWNCKLTEPCDDCKAIDNIPAAGFSTPPEVDIDLIRSEIEAIQQDVLKSSETPLDSAYNISIGISMALGVIDKYAKGEKSET